ncbi:MAG: hypothetical protein A2V90_06490 [Gammaproteobacteria bacterium RBG_16_57_12]|nr:MAG: hypothetical protein A2V90_06490 [Gammaproteobacteria bacterium RBG_16_57_12]
MESKASQIKQGTGTNPSIHKEHPAIIDCPPASDPGSDGAKVIPAQPAGSGSTTLPATGAGDVACRPPKKDTPAARFNMGRLSFWFKNYKQALEFWRPLAEQDYAPAQSSLGWMYQNGIGVEKDNLQAVHWYTKAALQGEVKAQTNLGILYEQGLGVAKDMSEAARWYQMASDQNYRFAHYNLAILYLNGAGVKKDRQKAVDLFFKAYELDVEEAATQLKVMGIQVFVKEKKKAPPRPPQHEMILEPK